MLIGLLLPAVILAQGQQPPPAPLRIAASSFATVEVHLNSRRIGNSWYEEDASLTGPSRIAISYGQPHARGRKVEGGLVPLDTVWRFGANTVRSCAGTPGRCSTIIAAAAAPARAPDAATRRASPRARRPDTAAANH